MAFLTILVISLVVLAAVAYWALFMDNGRKIRVRIFEKGSDGIFELDSHKKIYGFVRLDGKLSKLFLKKKYATIPLAAPMNSELIFSGKVPTFHILRESENLFSPIKVEFTSKDKQTTLEFNQVDHADLVHYLAETEKTQTRFQKGQHWLEKYGAIVGVVLIIFTGLIVISLVNQHSVELIEEHRNDALAQVTVQTSLFEKILANVNKDNSQSINDAPTNASRPLS